MNSSLIQRVSDLQGFVVFDDDDAIAYRPRLNSCVYVAMTIPTDDSHPEMIAAREQLVSVVGS
ncbi:MAG: hypothetical protein WBG57_01245 [Ornithinimicrobium sp.]